MKAALTQADYQAKLQKDAPIQSKDVATLPRPGTSSPTSIKFHSVPNNGNDNDTTAEDVWITYLLSQEATSLTRQLYATNIATHETRPLFAPPSDSQTEYSLEEKLRRERARLMATGVTSYQVASGTNHNVNDDMDTSNGATTQEHPPIMLVPLGGVLWILDDPLGSTGEPRKLVEPNTNEDDSTAVLPLHAPILDAKLSADGSTVAFCADQEVYVVSTSAADNNVPRQVTFGARSVDGHSHGLADYLAQEELERADGFWLSPQGTQFVFEAVDESHIPPYRIQHQGESKGLSTTLTTETDMRKASTVTYEEHRYPFAGTDNPKVRLGVTRTDDDADDDDASMDAVVWFDLEQVFGEDFYLAKVEWLKPTDDTKDSTQIVVQLLDRRQKNLALLLAD
eukprot:scaffold239363_cov50-Attheya_sp.AAC.1